MKNNFESGNGHIKSMGMPLIKDIAETMNETYKKQMEMSTEMYNQLIGVPFSKEKTPTVESFWGTNSFKSNLNFFEKNMEMYSDLFKKMTSLTFDPIYSGKEINSFSDKMYESIIGIYEKQIKQIKEFNNYFIEAVEKNTKGSSIDSSHLIKNFKNNMDENLDSYLTTAKIILKPDNKTLLQEMNKQIDSAFKSNLTYWSDLIISMSKGLKGQQKETHEKTVKETKKENSHTTHKK